MQTELVIKDVAEDFRLLRTYQSIHTNGGRTAWQQVVS